MIKSEQNRTSIAKSKMLQALEKSIGVVTPALKCAGVHRSVFYEWLKKDKKFKQNVEDLNEVALDFVESKLFQRIRRGSDTAIIFYCKTKGRKRGFIEKHEIGITDNDGNDVFLGYGKEEE